MNEDLAKNIIRYNIEWTLFKFSIETNLFTRINQDLKIKKQDSCEEEKTMKPVETPCIQNTGRKGEYREKNLFTFNPDIHWESGVKSATEINPNQSMVEIYPDARKNTGKVFETFVDWCNQLMFGLTLTTMKGNPDSAKETIKKYWTQRMDEGGGNF